MDIVVVYVVNQSAGLNGEYNCSAVVLTCTLPLFDLVGRTANAKVWLQLVGVMGSRILSGDVFPGTT